MAGAHKIHIKHYVTPDDRRCRTASDPLTVASRPIEIVLLGFVATVQATVYAGGAATFYVAFNWFTPILVFLTLAWSCYRMATLNPLTFWTPLFWFRLACAVYYGIGPLVPLMADFETARGINSIFILDSGILFKVNLITLIGILLVLCSASAFIKLVPSKRQLSSLPFRQTEGRALRFAVYFLIIGGTLRYGVILPYVLGVSIPVLPGGVIALGKIYYAGIYLLVRSIRNDMHGRMCVAALLVFIEIAVSISSFSKTDLIFILVFSLMGIVEVKRGLLVSVIGIAGIATVYFSFQPLVLYGRDRVVQIHGSINGAGLGERWEIIRDYMTVEGRVERVGYGNGMSRLSYASANAFVIAQYDAGLKGDTLRNAAAVFVPRALWEDKPIISDVGEDLYFAVSGRHGSSMGVGHFSEAYWNFGWLGLGILMLPIGIILTAYSRVSISIMARNDWILLPVVLMGVQIGLRVDGHFVPDVVGPLWMALITWLALGMIGRAISARKQDNRRVGG